ncbi:hypothetical protein QJS10_CPB20g00044 [Acorus calamus]|uniref:AB hydrolase-1 domain-containing protein n=1 Tax=Acorus calamus TaxID=4465 RepID=A0AAV9CAS8_ACOCL|nr:hypothetical protein QJS10_CPB20g00044 [Acorus calamus]
MVRISRFATSPRPTSLDRTSSSSGNWDATWSLGEYVFRRSMDFRRRSVTLGGAGGVNPVSWTQQKKHKKRNVVAGVDQQELFDPESLADPDSLFFDFKGVHIHYKEHIEKDEHIPSSSSSSLKVKYPFVLLHGFGASSFSWKLAMGPLSSLTYSKVLAFDRPAFGLTSRIISSSRSGGTCEGDDDIAMRVLNPYSMGFSVRSTLSFIDHLSAEKAILIGHSAGCLVAVNTYLEAPERVAALILVCPAIAAPLISINGTSEVRIQNTFGTLYRKALSAILNSSFAVTLTRTIIDVFGLTIIRFAWHDSTRFTDHFVQGYTKPLKTKGWELALLEFANAMVTDSESKPPLMKRLSKISCPVLIITGDNDRIIPTWNAKNLSSAIPGSILEVIQNCGHLPHEEKVEEFSSAVEKFLHRVFGDSDLKQEKRSNQC